MSGYYDAIRKFLLLRDAGSSGIGPTDGKPGMTGRIGILAWYTSVYALVAASMLIGDAVLTDYLLEHLPNTFELNVRVDSSSITGLLSGVPTSLAILTGLFLSSMAMYLVDEKDRELLSTKGRWNRFLIRMPGAVAIWGLILVFGALVNNAGMVFFQYSWTFSLFNIIGFETEREQMAALYVLPAVSLVILVTPSYLIFSRIADRAKRRVSDKKA